MGATGRNTHNSRWPWSLVGLVLVLAFVGHDLAMAGDAHEIGESGHHGDGIAAVHHPMPVTQESRTDLHPHRMDASSHTSLDGCGYDRVAVLSVDNGKTIDLHDPVDCTVVEHTSPTPQFVVIHEPTAPPGVRRALLQIFRI